MRDLTHAQASELLAEAALDALPADEQAAVLAHARGCPDCGPTLTALKNATAQLAYAVPHVTDDPVRRARVRNRLMARARADLAVADEDAASAEATSSLAVPAEPSVATVAGTVADEQREERSIPARRPVRIGARVAKRSWLASPAAAWSVAGVVGIAAVLIVAVLTMRSADGARESALAHEADLRRIAQINDSLTVRDSALRELTGKQVSVMQLTAGTPRAPWAWMFWNHVTNRWTFMAHDLAQVQTGKTYQLWLVTPKGKVSAGTFMPRADGSAAMQATYALARDSLRAIAVTEEPSGGMPQPTGPMVMTVTAGQ